MIWLGLTQVATLAVAAMVLLVACAIATDVRRIRRCVEAGGPTAPATGGTLEFALADED